MNRARGWVGAEGIPQGSEAGGTQTRPSEPSLFLFTMRFFPVSPQACPGGENLSGS